MAPVFVVVSLATDPSPPFFWTPTPNPHCGVGLGLSGEICVSLDCSFNASYFDGGWCKLTRVLTLVGAYQGHLSK